MSDLLAANTDPAKELEQMKSLLKVILEHPKTRLMSMHRLPLEVKVYGYEEAMKRVKG